MMRLPALDKLSRELRERERAADAFERAYAKRSGVTVTWLRAHGRVVRPCHCGEPDCEGWQSVNRESYDDDELRVSTQAADAQATALVELAFEQVLAEDLSLKLRARIWLGRLYVRYRLRRGLRA